MIRRISFFPAAAFLVLLMASAAPAAPTATETIRQTVDEVLALIKDPKMHAPETRAPILQQVEGKIRTIFDFEEFSARTVGPKWRSFTDSQKTRFEDAFSSLLRETYIDKLAGYSGEKVDFLGEIKSASGDKVEVRTSILMKDKEVPVAYRLLDKNGVWKVYDVRIENVSLIENYRGQFKEILMKGDAEALIAKVEEKAAEIARQKNTAPQ